MSFEDAGHAKDAPFFGIRSHHPCSGFPLPRPCLYPSCALNCSGPVVCACQGLSDERQEGRKETGVRASLQLTQHPV
jgi:hypothetical protein